MTPKVQYVGVGSILRIRSGKDYVIVEDHVATHGDLFVRALKPSPKTGRFHEMAILQEETRFVDGKQDTDYVNGPSFTLVSTAPKYKAASA